MNEIKKVAVFIDSAEARLITFRGGFAEFAGRIESQFEPHPRYRGEGSNQARFGTDPYHGSNNEFGRHRLEEALKKSYFHELMDALLPFDEILLFGPGETKKELHNQLLGESAFREKALHVQNSDHITDNQLLETARIFFAFQGNEQAG